MRRRTAAHRAAAGGLNVNNAMAIFLYQFKCSIPGCQPPPEEVRGAEAVSVMSI